jgi:alkyl hydroperoxide reductase subunit AhpC
MPSEIAVGAVAPDFELRDQHGQAHRLSILVQERPVLLVFYPFAFTPTCAGELGVLRDAHANFRERVLPLGISCDPVSALRVFAEQETLPFPLLSDFWPHGEVSRQYGVFLEDRGFATRGSFLIDQNAVVRWSVVNSPAEKRDLNDYLTALDALG